jgi:hypothetical protein
MGAVDLRDVDRVLTNRITEWHREHYLCSTTVRLHTGSPRRAIDKHYACKVTGVRGLTQALP